jgi:tetratricopeptide (TPR) repeat protein/tRNA A-37 threonylcarbamoyl transferase component Bud32
MLPAIGEYEILGELGAGAYGEVYRARHRRLDRLVALKVLWNSAEDLGRFRREMQVLARLHHPGLVKLLDADHGAGRAYIAFELIDGPNLEACIGRFAPFPWPTATAIAITVARAISYLHDQGVLHRDVKPANVLLSRSTGIKLADFGLVRWSGVDARLTRTGERLGTLIYLPPEAIDSELTTNGDLWALGCTLYQMLTGRMHLCADDFDAWSKKIICGGFPAPSDIVPSVPVELSDFVLSMLSVDPHSRPGTAAAVAQRLEGLLPAGVTVESLLAPPGLHKLLEGLEQAGAAIEEPAKTRRLEPRERSHRRTAALLAVVIGAASVLLLVCWIRSRPETPRLAQRLTPEALWQAGKEAEAVNACKEALRTDGGNAALHAQLGSYLEKLGRIPEAMDHIRSSLALSHRDDLERQFCMMLVQNRQVDEAVSRLRRQVRLHPKPEDFAALAIALEKQGHLESAERSAREAMQLAPTNAHYVGIRAAIHYSMGRYDEAIQGLRKALRQIPNEPQFRTQLGLALQKSHRLDEAITELRTAVRLSPPVSFYKS